MCFEIEGASVSCDMHLAYEHKLASLVAPIVVVRPYPEAGAQLVPIKGVPGSCSVNKKRELPVSSSNNCGGVTVVHKK